MLKQKIKTHKFGNKYQQEHFFILNKGNNAGKPLPEFCANCFVFIADDVNESEFYFYLFYGLWQGGLFRPFIIGSVIPYIRLNDLIKVADVASRKVNRELKNYESAIEVLKDLEKHHDILMKKMELVKQTKKVLMYKMFR